MTNGREAPTRKDEDGKADVLAYSGGLDTSVAVRWLIKSSEPK